jgi:hypothetical protein
MSVLNRGDLIIPCCKETKYTCTNYDLPFVFTYIIKEINDFKILDYSLNDITLSFIDQHLSWEMVSKNIIYCNNTNCSSQFRTIVFHDSFLLEPQRLFMNILSETFFIKNTINAELIDLIKPDYILEFRIERFLF